MSEHQRCGWCYSQCTWEINAAQTAGTREQMKRCTLGWPSLVSVSTLTDEQICFLLSYIKKEICSVLSCTSPTRDAVGPQRRCQSTIKGAVSPPRVLVSMQDSREEGPWRDSVFGKLCKRALEKRKACLVPAELKGF